MGRSEKGKAGMLTEFLVEDHRRLDGLLYAASADPGTVDDCAYTQFRAGLLRHIGMEEKFYYLPLSGSAVENHFP